MRRARIVLVLALAGLAAFLVAAPPPWSWEGGPDFAAAGRPLSATVAIAMWWAAAANALLCLLLLATARRWAGADVGAVLPLPPRPGRRLVLLLLLAAVLGGALRWNLAHSGLWADEGWSVRNTITGMEERSRRDPSRLVLHEVGWRETLWSYERPTNHVLYSVLARASIGGWRIVADRDPPAFDEFALRLPSLVAAVASIVLIGLLLADWGLPRAGVAAAFLLAVHPWHLVYGSDGRAYSLVVLFATAAAWALTRALSTGRGRAWLGYALAVFGLLWAQPIAIYLVVGLAAAGAVAIVAAGTRPRRRLARLVVAHLAAGMLVLQVMAPNLAQFPEWGRFAGGRNAVTPAALGHLWSLAATGVEARQPDVPERKPGAYPSLASTARDGGWWVYPVALGLIPLLLVAGLVRVLGRRGPPAWVTLGWGAGVPLALAVTAIQGGQWYPRFAIFVLPLVVGLIAVGLEGLLAALPWPSARAQRLGVAAGLVLGLLGFQAFVAAKTRVLLTRPFTASRELVARWDRETGGDPAAGIRGMLGLVGGNNHIEAYDPWIREFDDAQGLAELCAEARVTGKPLFVAYGYPGKNRKQRPGPFRWLDDPAYFREIALFDGSEVERLIRLLRYTGAPLAEARE